MAGSARDRDATKERDLKYNIMRHTSATVAFKQTTTPLRLSFPQTPSSSLSTLSYIYPTCFPRAHPRVTTKSRFRSSDMITCVPSLTYTLPSTNRPYNTMTTITTAQTLLLDILSRPISKHSKDITCLRTDTPRSFPALSGPSGADIEARVQTHGAGKWHTADHTLRWLKDVSTHHSLHFSTTRRLFAHRPNHPDRS